MSQNRVQFTPDVLPADITGFSIYRKDTGKFEYQPGAVMCNLLLADEINRTSPKTQSALLEVMEEGNVTVGDASLLAHGAAALDPLARCLGLDGTILIAFILGFPANEIVFPIIIMAYMAQGQLTDMGDLAALHTLLVNNGWTWLTAACTMLFSVMHWPCSTTCLTIRKETGSAKWTLLAMLIPTLTGGVLCAAVAAVGRLFL